MSSAVGGHLPVVEIPTCCGSSSAPIAPSASQPVVATKFHFALNVSDLERSIAFYRILFDVPPAKHYPDYAKFELSQPPLVFSLVPNPPASGGTLSHFGLPGRHSGRGASSGRTARGGRARHHLARRGRFAVTRGRIRCGSPIRTATSGRFTSFTKMSIPKQCGRPSTAWLPRPSSRLLPKPGTPSPCCGSIAS